MAARLRRAKRGEEVNREAFGVRRVRAVAEAFVGRVGDLLRVARARAVVLDEREGERGQGLAAASRHGQREHAGRLRGTG